MYIDLQNNLYENLLDYKKVYLKHKTSKTCNNIYWIINLDLWEHLSNYILLDELLV